MELIEQIKTKSLYPLAPQILGREDAILRMNNLGKQGEPFLFLISFDTRKCIVIENPEHADQPGLIVRFPNFSNDTFLSSNAAPVELSFEPPSRFQYQEQFNSVQEEMQRGNVYLLNLTRSTPIQASSGLEDIYVQARARYKVYLPGQFVVFSPETFVRIEDGKIRTFPMKGTIRTDVPHAREFLENSQKERAEHASVVDLLRNDLGEISQKVRVNRYRYFEKVRGSHYQLWQVSSEIEGILPANFYESLGSILFRLLPAGSISGVPKQKALEIIRNVEDFDRGFYTGICGYFDGHNLDSGVMIRFIEQTPNGLVYKSGGGIHRMSEMEMEYEELINKIYVPLD